MNTRSEPHPETVLLTQEDVAATMTLADYIQAVEQAFHGLGSGAMRVPPVPHIAADGGVFHIKSAGFTTGPAYVAVKVNGNFPDNRARHGLPTIQGVIILCDGRNGSVLAVMDSVEVTAMRTGAATAVAARHLVRGEPHSATIVGCGVQGRVQALALREVLPLRTIHAFDLDTARRDAFVERLQAETGLNVIAADSLADATRSSDVIAACTSSRRPFLGPEHVRPGTFIAAVGADSADKHELDVQLMARARVVADLTEQCAEIGDLHHAVAAGVMEVGSVFAELADIVTGRIRPEFADQDIVVFDSTGTAVQDVAAAGIIYERARAAGAGLAVALTS